jgi:hypothetical protein
MHQEESCWASASDCFPDLTGVTDYYFDIPKNDWLAGHQKCFNTPSDFFTPVGFAATVAIVVAVERAKPDRHGEAHRRNGGDKIRYGQGRDNFPQGGPSGAQVRWAGFGRVRFC